MEKTEFVFFRFYDLAEKQMNEFADEVKALTEPIMKEIVKTEIVDATKTMNIGLDGVAVKEVRVHFSGLDKCREFRNAFDKHIDIYQKYSNMSETSRGSEVVRREPTDTAFNL
jgi:hypothetical protein